MKRKEKTLEEKSAAARALTTNYSREDEAANDSTVRIPQTDNNFNTSSTLLFVTSPRSCDVPTPKKEVFAQNIFYTCPKKLIFHGRKKKFLYRPKKLLKLV